MCNIKTRYCLLIEKNAYNFRDETIQLDALRFDKFYEFLSNTTFNFADKNIFFKNRDIFIEKMFNLSKKIMNIIYLDEEFSSFRDNDFVKNFLDKVEFTKKNEILDTLKTCVSTPIVGCPKALFRTTFAVFLPTPGRASSSFLVSGTSELYLSMSILQV